MASGQESFRHLLVCIFCVSLFVTCRADVYQSFLEPGSDVWPGADLWSTLLYTVQTYNQQQKTYSNATRLPQRLELDTEDDFSSEDEDAGPSARDRAIGAALGPYITPIANPGISKACQQASQAYMNNIMRKEWALKMFDATGKLPDGLIEGNLNAFGNWDECLNITAAINSSDIDGQDPVVREFSGKYCFTYVINTSPQLQALQENGSARPIPPVGMLPIVPDIPKLTIANGICIPSVCTYEELMIGVNTYFKGKAFLYTKAEYCATKDDVTEISSGGIVMLVILGLTGLMMVIGTIIDLVDTYARESPESGWSRTNGVVKRCSTPGLRRVFRAFSVYTNGSKLLDTSSTSDTMGCLHGIRFLSNTWVILGHTYYFTIFFRQRNLAVLVSDLTVAFQAVSNATVSVDSFFFLSGLLVAYGFMRQMQRTGGKFNIIMFYVHRYIRLTPVMMIVIGFIATLYVNLGSGPTWGDASTSNPAVCQDNWWTNMLYVNNLVHENRQCLGQTWYLANDMQMFIFSPLVLLPLWYAPTFGQLWIVLLICVFTGINAAVTAVNRIGLPGGGDGNLRYQKPWCRAGAYLVGIYTGWILFKIRGKKIHLPSPVVAIGWITSALTACLIVYGTYGLPSPPSHAENIIYAMLNRTAWTVCLAWVVFACVTGYGRFVNDLLSWKAFIPLSRLTYTSYLVHIDIQLYYWYTNKMPVYLDQTFVVYMFLGSLPIIFAVSVLFSLAFESPMIALEKIMFGQPSRPRTEPLLPSKEPVQGGADNAGFVSDNVPKDDKSPSETKTALTRP